LDVKIQQISFKCFLYATKLFQKVFTLELVFADLSSKQKKFFFSPFFNRFENERNSLRILGIHKVESNHFDDSPFQ